MARPCTICRHPHRAEIDAALTGGVPFRNVAKQWNAGDSSVYRHSQGCIGKVLAKVGLDISKQREAGKGVAPGPEYGAAMLIARAEDRSSKAMALADQAGSLLARAETFLDDLEAQDDHARLEPKAVEAFAKVLASATSAVTAAVSALGGGAGRHDELAGKIDGSIKPASVTINLQQAIAVLIDPKTKRLAPEVQERLDTETRRYLTAAIDAMAVRVPVGERQAAREAAWAAAKAARDGGVG